MYSRNMPYKIKHLPHSNKVRVYNKQTGRAVAKRTTIEKAKKQVRLLHMIDNKRRYI